MYNIAFVFGFSWQMVVAWLIRRCFSQFSGQRYTSVAIVTSTGTTCIFVLVVATDVGFELVVFVVSSGFNEVSW